MPGAQRWMQLTGSAHPHGHTRDGGRRTEDRGQEEEDGREDRQRGNVVGKKQVLAVRARICRILPYSVNRRGARCKRAGVEAVGTALVMGPESMAIG